MESTETKVGDNKTGIMTSIKEAMKTMEGALKLTVPPKGNHEAIGENRVRFMQEGFALGTLPPPAGLKGMAASLKEKVLTGNHVFMDKLGERIAFERTGTRLYEALISKHQGTEDKTSLPDLSILQRFHLEEMQHFNLTAKAMQSIGGDPTAMTPSADVCGVAGMGWVQVIADPRTTFLQSLEIILQAELVDNACWETLISLADNLGLKNLVEDFNVALAEEAEHLQTVKTWVTELNLNGKVSGH